MSHDKQHLQYTIFGIVTTRTTLYIAMYGMRVLYGVVFAMFPFTIEGARASTLDIRCRHLFISVSLV